MGVTVLGLFLTGACSQVEAFPGSAGSLDELGEGVLLALAEGDRSALEELRLSEAEHNEVVWPELPASAPEVNFPVDLAWTNIQTRNVSAIVRIVPLYDGRPVRYVATECRGDIQRFDTFEVLTDCWVQFELESQPELFEAQLFKDVLVRAQGHKIFRYYDEEPRALRTTETD